MQINITDQDQSCHQIVSKLTIIDEIPRPQIRPISKLTISDNVQSEFHSYIAPKLGNANNGCYANSVIQCLLRIDPLMNRVNNVNSETHPLINQMQKLYQNPNQNLILNNRDIRLILTNYARNINVTEDDFSMTAGFQCDALVFLEYFIGLLNDLIECRSLFEFENNDIYKCKKCNNCKEIKSNNLVYNLYVGKYDRGNTASGDEIHLNLNLALNDDTCERVDYNCADNECDGKESDKKVVISANQYLIIKVWNLLTDQDKYKYVFDDLDPNSINIGEETFKIIAIINHFGENAKSGHYIANIRNNDDSWIQCNDSEITYNFNLNTKLNQAYVLILQKVSSVSMSDDNIRQKYNNYHI